MPYEQQLERKRAIVQAAFDAALGTRAPRVKATLAARAGDGHVASVPTGFRQKVHFVCGKARDDGRFALGHFAAGGQRVVSVDECSVHADRGNQLAWRVRDACRTLDVSAARPNGTGGLLRHVVIRASVATGETLVTLVVTDARDRRVSRLARALQDGPQSPAGIFVSQLRGPSSWLFGPVTTKLAGRAFVRERLGDTWFFMGPTAFFQTNIAAAEVLVRLVLDLVPRDAKRVLDLYSGVGAFALPLASRGHRVVAIEEHPGAVDAGERSRRLNGLAPQSCRFICEKVERGLRGATATSGADVVVLDPPRSGCAPTALTRLAAEVRPLRIVYVSCDPSTLARDVRQLCDRSIRGGRRYDVVNVQPLDMFPHTPHVEAVALLMASDGQRAAESNRR